MSETGVGCFIDRTGTVVADGFKVKVKVIDVRQAYGRTDLRLQAIDVTGVKWAKVDKVEFDPKERNK